MAQQWEQFQRYSHCPLKTFGTCYPKICCFSVLIILRWRPLKNSKCQEMLSPHLLKDRVSKSLRQKSPLWESRQPGETGSYHKRGDQKLDTTPDKLCYKLPYLPSIFLRPPSFFLKILYSPLSDFHHCLPTIKTVYKLSRESLYLEYHLFLVEGGSLFFLVMPPYT